MTTSEVCKTLRCCSSTVFALRREVYPEGHALAGRPVLGVAVYANRTWHYDANAVRTYRDWLIDGKPLDTKPARAVNTLQVEERLRRAMART